jgi:hypothetical protein
MKRLLRNQEDLAIAKNQNASSYIVNALLLKCLAKIATVLGARIMKNMEKNDKKQ